MPHLCLCFRVPQQLAAQVIDFLEQQRSLAVTVESATDADAFDAAAPGTPDWPVVDVSGLFADDRDATGLIAAARRQLGPLPCRSRWLADRDWEAEYLRYFKPQQVGAGLWVVPGNCRPPDPHAINLVLEPGLAFGTGQHPTTHMCLQWLSRAVLRGKRVVDYGCGSGILAVAALMMGARCAWGVDIDQRALQVSSDNARRNGVIDRYTACCSAALPAGLRADIVLANILAPALIELASALTALVAQNGLIILSGIKEGREQQVAAHFANHFRFETTSREAWSLLCGRRR